MKIFSKLSVIIIFWIGILLIIIFSIISFILFNTEKNLLINYAYKRADITNKIILNAFYELMPEKHIKTLKAFYKKLPKIKEISEVRIIRGEPVIRQFGIKKIFAPKDKWDEQALKGKEIKIIEYVKGHREIRLIMPVKVQEVCLNCHEQAILGEINGAISVSISIADIDNTIKKRKTFLFYTTLFTIFLVALLLFILLKLKILNHLWQLIKATKKIASGDLQSKVDIQSKDEIGILAENFNIMTTELNKAQNSLVQSEKMVAIGKIASSVAHEINNPLEIILSVISAISLENNAGKISANLQQDLEVISKHTMRISDITRGLLTFARQSTDKKQPLNINNIIEQTLFLTNHQFKKKQIIVKKCLSENLPYILGNVNQLQQVIFNILNNSMDAMPDGGELIITTNIIKIKEEGFIELKIKDNGSGIPKEYLNKIFEPFFTTKELSKGTGLGLSIVYGIIKEHLGEIKVESNTNGTLFIILFPMLEKN